MSWVSSTSITVSRSNNPDTRFAVPSAQPARVWPSGVGPVRARIISQALQPTVSVLSADTVAVHPWAGTSRVWRPLPVGRQSLRPRWSCSARVIFGSDDLLGVVGAVE